MTVPEIKDKFYITYGIFYLLGILTFIPSYFVITANRYWMFKFRFIGPRPPKPDHGSPGPPNERNMLQASFPSAYYIVSQSSLIAFIILTAAQTKKLPPPEKRISAALLCTLVFYIVNIIFCFLVTDMFQLYFFSLVMCIAGLLGGRCPPYMYYSYIARCIAVQWMRMRITDERRRNMCFRAPY